MPVSKEKLRRWAELLQQAQVLRAQNPLEFFRPYPPDGASKQWQFFLCTKKGRLFIGDNRIGKTVANTVELLYHFTGRYPPWYPEEGKIHPKRRDQHIRGRLVVTDFQKHLDEVITPEIERWMPKDLAIVPKKNPQGHVIKYSSRFEDQKTKMTYKSTLDIMSAEQDLKQFEGWSGFYAAFDEPVPQDRFAATLRGLMDFDGRWWLTATVISEPWIYDELYLAGLEKKKEIGVFEAEVTENPYVPKEGVESFKSTVPGKELLGRLGGKVRHLHGLVYPELLEPGVWIEPFDVAGRDPYTGGSFAYTFYHGADIHDREAGRLAWFAVDPGGAVLVYDAVILKDLTLAELAKEIKIREATVGVPIKARFLDPNFGRTRSIQTQLTAFQALSKEGLYYIPADDSIPLGHNTVRQYLRSGKFHAFRSLEEYRHEMTRYVYDQEEYKHFPDVTRYVLRGNIKYIPPPDPELTGWRKIRQLQDEEVMQSHGAPWYA